MRNGGGKAKGNAFETKVATALSLWLTDGKKKDALSRNILSGGRFTVTTLGMPGDIIAVHPAAFEFCSKVTVECKHYADIGIERFFFQPDNSFLGRVFRKTREQCEPEGYFPVIVAKSNRVEPILITDSELGQLLIASAKNPRKFGYHLMHRERFLVTTFAALVEYVDAPTLLALFRDIPAA